MKKLFLVVVFLNIGLYAISQNVKLNNLQLEKVLCKSWDIDFALMSGLKIYKLPTESDFELEFDSDGYYYITSRGGERKKGRWRLYTKKKLIALFIDNRTTSYIKSIANDKMVLQLVNEDDDSGLAHLEVYLSPF